MNYQVVLPRTIIKVIENLPAVDGRRVLEAINDLAQNPRPPGCRKLTGRPGWRIRVGNYRIIYEIADAQHLVTVRDVDHRGQVYR